MSGEERLLQDIEIMAARPDAARIAYSWERAREQRHQALRNALATVDLFAAPSCPPAQYAAFNDLREYLLSRYDPNKIF